MIRPNYTVLERGTELSIQWPSPSIPEIFLPLGIVLVLAGLSVFLARKPLFENFKQRWDLKSGNTRLFGWAGTAVILGGLALTGLAGQKSAPIRWTFDAGGIHVTSVNGQASVPWDKIESVRLDEREPEIKNASLVIVDNQGKEIWLILKWLIKPHRYKIISRLGDRLPGAMKPIMENEIYISELRGHG